MTIATTLEKRVGCTVFAAASVWLLLAPTVGLMSGDGAGVVLIWSVPFFFVGWLVFAIPLALTLRRMTTYRALIASGLGAGIGGFIMVLPKLIYRQPHTKLVLTPDYLLYWLLPGAICGALVIAMYAGMLYRVQAGK